MKAQSTVTIGHVIGGSFGVAFVIANSTPMGRTARVICIILAIAAFAVTLFAFLRGVSQGTIARPESASERFGRSYWLIVLVEAIALFGGASLLNRLQPSAVVGWIALVVGLHFFWLARLWPSGSRDITLIAIALTSLGAIGLLIAFTADSIDTVALASGVGSGVVLLAGSLTGAVRSFRQPRPGLDAASDKPDLGVG